MVRWTLVCLVCLPAWAPGRASAETPTLRLLSYNIHHGRGTDGAIDLPRIAAVITRTQPDLVALQELDRQTRRSGGVDQAARLGELTGMQFVFGQALEYDGGQYGEAILSRWQFRETRLHPLPADPGFEPRAALACRVAWSPGRDLWFVATHLDHTHADGQRRAQLREIVRLFPADGPTPVLLAGDLNATPESPVLELLRPAWMSAGGGPTWPSAEPRKQLDYVFLRRSDAWHVEGVESIDQQVASDHRPLLVVLQWRPAGRPR
jgi:endonuclease/exonuclease/phosphatase family metal-dependent hydrolase